MSDLSALPAPAAAPATPRRRGRPPGRRSSLAGEQALLRLPHFHFVRAALELPLRTAWLRYLAFEGGPDDERHFASRLRQLGRQIRGAAEQRGLAALAEIGLHSHRALAAPTAPPLPARPALEDWIAERCERLGIEPDFHSQAEWLSEYAQEFGLDSRPGPLTATALGSPAAATPGQGPSLKEQLQALHRLAAELARAPALDDPLAGWLAPSLARALQAGGVTSLQALIDFVRRHGPRWHRRIRGLGADRAGRLLDWLAPLAEQLGHPLPAELLRGRGAPAASSPAALPRFGLVPLERLVVPPALSGRDGRFRGPPPNAFEADEDLPALRAWLQRHAGSPRTHAAYSHEVERFYLWCLLEARKPLSSLEAADLRAYRDFLAQPPTHWVQARRVERDSEAWRPLRGPLSPASQRRALSVVSALLDGLVQGGYLSAHAAHGLAASVSTRRPAPDADRAFTEAQWQQLLQTLAEQPDTAFTRRTRLVLELGASSGLRLGELSAARLGALRRERIDGAELWLLEVAGRAGAPRWVPLPDEVKRLIDRHQQDLRAAPGQPEDVEEAARPLIGALRAAPPRPAPSGAAPAGRDGALEPSALYQSLKRLFARAAQRAAQLGADAADADGLRRASTHWLRHFFARNAVADGVHPVALMQALGHADLRSTACYLPAEAQQAAREFAKLRRRG